MSRSQTGLQRQRANQKSQCQLSAIADNAHALRKSSSKSPINLQHQQYNFITQKKDQILEQLKVSMQKKVSSSTSSLQKSIEVPRQKRRPSQLVRVP